MTKRLALALLAAAALVALVVSVLLYFFVMYPPPGDEIASVVARTGEPFALQYVSTGEPQRVWLDFECSECSDGADARGVVVATANGSTITTCNIDTFNGGLGNPVVEHIDEGIHHVIKGMLLCEIAAQPSGVTVVIRGAMTIGAGISADLSYDGESVSVGEGTPGVSPLRAWIAP